MSKLTERQRLILTIAVAVVITAGLLALILKDRGEIKTVNEEVSTLRSRIRAADVEIRRTQEREERVLVFRAVEDAELAILPTKQKIASFHRNLSTFIASAGLTFRELPESSPVESDLSPGIFVTRTTLTCQGDSAALLKFLNMLENDPRLLSVKGLRVQAGQKDPRNPGLPVVHDIEVHLETYFYVPRTTAAQRVHIPGTEARLQEPRLKEAIASFQPERPDTYVLRPSTSRRDPMVDPRRALPSINPEDMEEEWLRQEAIVVELESRLAGVNEKVEQEKALLRAGDLFRRDRLAAEIELALNEIGARLAQVDQMKTVVIPDLVVRVQEVRARAEVLRSRRTPRELTVTRTVAEKMLEDVMRAFEDGDYASVGSLTAAWSQYLHGKAVESDALGVVEQIGSLRQRAKTLADFQAIPIRVTGTIVHPTDPSRSVALINGNPLRSGQPLKERPEVVVGRIEKEAVEFLFEGEAIRVRRAGSAPAAEGIRATLPPG